VLSELGERAGELFVPSPVSSAPASVSVRQSSVTGNGVAVGQLADGTASSGRFCPDHSAASRTNSATLLRRSTQGARKSHPFRPRRRSTAPRIGVAGPFRLIRLRPETSRSRACAASPPRRARGDAAGARSGPPPLRVLDDYSGWRRLTAVRGSWSRLRVTGDAFGVRSPRTGAVAHRPVAQGRGVVASAPSPRPEVPALAPSRLGVRTRTRCSEAGDRPVRALRTSAHKQPAVEDQTRQPPPAGRAPEPGCSFRTPGLRRVGRRVPLRPGTGKIARSAPSSRVRRPTKRMRRAKAERAGVRQCDVARSSQI